MLFKTGSQLKIIKKAESIDALGIKKEVVDEKNPKFLYFWTKAVSADEPNCFTAGHKILLSNGNYKNIEDIVVGDAVRTHTGEAKPVSNTFKRVYSGDLYRVKLLGIPDPIVCTPNHKFFVMSGTDSSKKREYQKLWKKGNRGIYNPETYIDWSDVSSKLEEISKINENDRFCIKKPIKESFDSKFSQFSDLEFARLAGYYVSEGCLFKKLYSRGIVLCLNKYKDLSIIEDVKNICLANGHKPYIRKNYANARSYQVAVIDVGWPEFYDFVLHFFGQHAKDKFIHSSIYSMSDEWIKEFIKAYLNGDGCFSSKGNSLSLRANSASINLLYGLQRLLSKIDVPSSVSHCTQGEGGFGEGNDIYEISISSSHIHKILGGNIYSKMPMSKFIIEKDNLLTQISSIEILENQNTTVYNFEVAGDHSYIVNNISCKNCNGDSFPLEVLKESYKTFIGRNMFLDHNSGSVINAIGKVVDADLVEDPETHEIGVYCLGKIDRIACPDVALKLESGTIDSVSMGASVSFSECSLCHHVASTAEDMCEHMAYLGKIYPGTNKKVISINSGVNFTELSLVSTPADPSALVKSIIAEKKDTGISLDKKEPKELKSSIDTNDDEVVKQALSKVTAFELIKLYKAGLVNLDRHEKVAVGEPAVAPDNKDPNAEQPEKVPAPAEGIESPGTGKPEVKPAEENKGIERKTKTPEEIQAHITEYAGKVKAGEFTLADLANKAVRWTMDKGQIKELINGVATATGQAVPADFEANLDKMASRNRKMFVIKSSENTDTKNSQENKKIGGSNMELKATFIKLSSLEKSRWLVVDKSTGRIVLRATLEGLFGKAVKAVEKYATGELGKDLVATITEKGVTKEAIMNLATEKVAKYSPSYPSQNDVKTAPESTHDKASNKVKVETDEIVTKAEKEKEVVKTAEKGATDKEVTTPMEKADYKKEDVNKDPLESGHGKNTGKVTSETDKEVVASLSADVNKDTSESGHAKSTVKVKTETDEEVTASKKSEISKEASAFDKTQEPIALGDGYTAIKDEKSKEITVKDKLGKECGKYPDGFGDDIASIIKLLRVVCELDKKEKSEKKEEKSEHKEEKKEEKSEKKVEKAEEKAEKVKSEKPKVESDELKKVKTELSEMKIVKALEEKSIVCKDIVKAMADKGLLRVKAEYISESIKVGNSLIDAKKHAFGKSVDEQMKKLLAMDNISLESFKDSIDNVEVKEVKASTGKEDRVLKTALNVQASEPMNWLEESKMFPWD